MHSESDGGEVAGADLPSELVHSHTSPKRQVLHYFVTVRQIIESLPKRCTLKGLSVVCTAGLGEFLFL